MNSGELLNQLLIDLQSLFRISFRKKKFTLSQINLISSIPINGIEMTSISSYLGIDNSTLTRNVNVLIKQNILKRNVNPKDGRSKLLVLTSHGINVKLELENIQHSFETTLDSQNLNNQKEINTFKLKSKTPQKTSTGSVIVKFVALDKITAKTSTINIPLGKKKKFGYLEIFPKKCALSTSDNNKGVVAYIQVKDLSNKRADKVFVFNGWTFSSSVTLRTFDHPVYDLWLTGCENI